MKNPLGLSALAVVAILGVNASANATVYVQLKEGGLTQDFSDSQNVSLSKITFGDYKIVDLSASDEFDALFSQFKIGSTAKAAHKLTISVSATGITDPDTLAEFDSGFTKNGFSAGWTLTADTYLDPHDGKYTTSGAGVVHLGSAAFASTGALSDNDTLTTNPGLGPYSITTIYTLSSPAATSNSGGSAAASAVVDDPPILPEPGSLALLGTALAGLGVFARRRRQAA